MDEADLDHERARVAQKLRLRPKVLTASALTGRNVEPRARRGAHARRPRCTTASRRRSSTASSAEVVAGAPAAGQAGPSPEAALHGADRDRAAALRDPGQLAHARDARLRVLLENRLRERYGLDGVPLIIDFNERKQRQRERRSHRRKSLALFAPMTQLSDNEYLFTSESVTEGHPDKIADQISDGVLDAVLRDDPYGRVACETLVNTGLVVVSGEISTTTYVDIQDIARETIRKIGYIDADLGFSADSCAVLNAIDKQSPDIAQGVDQAYEARTDAADDDELDVAGAGDQGMMFGYATQRDATSSCRCRSRSRTSSPSASRDVRKAEVAPVPAPGRQDAGHRPLPRRQAGRDREAPDLHPAPRGRRVADPGRPLGARRRADPAGRPLRRRASCARTSSSTRPAAS